MSVSYDALSTFLVFFVGVPALVFQVMDPEVRRAVLKRPLPLLVGFGLPALGAVGGTIILVMLDVSGGGDKLFWGEVFLWLFATSTVAAVFVPFRFGLRDRIIVDLKNRAAFPLWNTRRKPCLDHAALETLLDLGEQSEPGEDTQLVLDALRDLVDQVRRHPLYSGDSFEMLIPRLIRLIASDSKPGHPANYHAAGQILQSVVSAAPPPGLAPYHHSFIARALDWANCRLGHAPLITPDPSPVDWGHATNALASLALAALPNVAHAREMASTVQDCIESLELVTHRHCALLTEASERLFDIGVSALECKQSFIGIAALAKLFALVEANAPAEGELVCDALSLAAHFWAGGSAACEHARHMVEQNEKSLRKPLVEAVEQARHHCLMTMHLGTADHLETMLKDRHVSLPEA